MSFRGVTILHECVNDTIALIGCVMTQVEIIHDIKDELIDVMVSQTDLLGGASDGNVNTIVRKLERSIESIEKLLRPLVDDYYTVEIPE